MGEGDAILVTDADMPSGEQVLLQLILARQVPLLRVRARARTHLSSRKVLLLGARARTYGPGRPQQRHRVPTHACLCSHAHGGGPIQQTSALSSAPAHTVQRVAPGGVGDRLATGCAWWGTGCE